MVSIQNDYTASVNCVTWSPDGSLFGVANSKHLVYIYSYHGGGDIRNHLDIDDPCHSLIKMAYSADVIRLFSCGANKGGHSYIVEWNEDEGDVKYTYNGFCKRSEGVVQFDTTNNRFLAAGDEFMIKFWDMNDVNLLTTIDASGGLPASPCIRFNKGGILLAVSTNNNGLKVLANSNGVRILRTVGAFDDSRAGSSSMVKVL